MFVKTLTFMILGAGLVTQLPPIPEMPIADTGMIFDTGGMDGPVDSMDTGVFADTGEMTDTGGMDDTGSASDSGAPNDTGSANEGSGDATDTGDTITGGNTNQSASDLTGEKGGCSTVGAAAGPWLLGLLGLLARRRL